MLLLEMENIKSAMLSGQSGQEAFTVLIEQIEP